MALPQQQDGDRLIDAQRGRLMSLAPIARDLRGFRERRHQADHLDAARRLKLQPPAEHLEQFFRERPDVFVVEHFVDVL
jgi:hypothetical protein